MKVRRRKILCYETMNDLERGIEEHEERGWWRDGGPFEKIVDNKSLWYQKLLKVTEDSDID